VEKGGEKRKKGGRENRRPLHSRSNGLGYAYSREGEGGKGENVNPEVIPCIQRWRREKKGKKGGGEKGKGESPGSSQRAHFFFGRVNSLRVPMISPKRKGKKSERCIVQPPMVIRFDRKKRRGRGKKRENVTVCPLMERVTWRSSRRRRVKKGEEKKEERVQICERRSYLYFYLWPLMNTMPQWGEKKGRRKGEKEKEEREGEQTCISRAATSFHSKISSRKIWEKEGESSALPDFRQEVDWLPRRGGKEGGKGIGLW